MSGLIKCRGNFTCTVLSSTRWIWYFVAFPFLFWLSHILL